MVVYEVATNTLYIAEHYSKGVIKTRTLQFIVDGQIIRKNPTCDFDGIVPGTTGYLQAEFSFSSEWNGTVKVAGFWRNGKECPPQVLKDGKTCIIPAEALTSRKFEIRVFGKRGKVVLATDKIEVRQDGGKI